MTCLQKTARKSLQYLHANLSSDVPIKVNRNNFSIHFAGKQEFSRSKSGGVVDDLILGFYCFLMLIRIFSKIGKIRKIQNKQYPGFSMDFTTGNVFLIFCRSCYTKICSLKTR